MSVNLIGVLFFQLVSIFEKVHSKFKSLLTQELEMTEQEFNMVYALFYSELSSGICQDEDTCNMIAR